MADWPLQDAKNKFSALVNAALAGEPQRVTRRGQPAVVVVATEEYERLCRLEKSNARDAGTRRRGFADRGYGVGARADGRNAQRAPLRAGGVATLNPAGC